MNRISSVAAALLVGAALSAPAFAQDGEGHVGIGYSHISLEDVDLGAVVFRGGWDFNEYLGVEAEGQVGIVEDDIGSVDVNLDWAWGLFAKAQFPVNDQFSVFGRVGYVDAEVDAGSLGDAGDDGVAFGAGGEWEFSPNNAIRGDYTRYEFDDTDADVFSISYVRRFGW